MSKSDPLRDPVLLPYLMSGLNRHHDRPCLYLGDKTATYAEVRARTSQYVQALAAKGLGVGSTVAVLSANPPEVLYNMAASSITGSSQTARKPLPSKRDVAQTPSWLDSKTSVTRWPAQGETSIRRANGGGST